MDSHKPKAVPTSCGKKRSFGWQRIQSIIVSCLKLVANLDDVRLISCFSEFKLSYPSNLSILINGGKETKRDPQISGERNGICFAEKRCYS